LLDEPGIALQKRPAESFFKKPQKVWIEIHGLAAGLYNPAPVYHLYQQIIAYLCLRLCQK